MRILTTITIGSNVYYSIYIFHGTTVVVPFY